MGAVSSSVFLLGDPVTRSLSPGMQNAAFAALGIDSHYMPREVDRAGLAGVIDELDPQAARIGAVNTISRQGSTLKGWNTDVEGFQRALAEQSGKSPSPLAGEGRGGGYRAAAIIGAGGAARAVAAALQPAAEVWVIARNLEQARRLCRDLEIERGGPVEMNQMREMVTRVDLVVNATPADLPPASWLRPDQRLFDLRSRRSGEGRAMLLYQGAAAFEIWTGRPAPIEAMRAALERAAEGVHA